MLFCHRQIRKSTDLWRPSKSSEDGRPFDFAQGRELVERRTFTVNSTELLPWRFPGSAPPCLSRLCGASPVALRWSPGSDFSFLKRDPHGSRLGAHGNVNFGHRGACCKYRHLARLEACFRFILDSTEIRRWIWFPDILALTPDSRL
jgi:hypothetical protein